jgi:hypothetical protein
MVVQACMDRDEFLQRLHLSEAEHGPLPSSQGRMTPLDTVIRPPAYFLTLGITELIHGSFVGAQSVGGDHLG